MFLPLRCFYRVLKHNCKTLEYNEGQYFTYQNFSQEMYLYETERKTLITSLLWLIVFQGTLEVNILSQCRWLRPVILATQKAEIRRIMVQSQPRQIVHETLSQKKKPHHKKGWWSGPQCRP
jgi:hypothetical protein